MYDMLIPNSVKRNIKKLDHQVIVEVLELLNDLTINPFQGSMLTGEFNNLRKLEFKISGIQYRIAYKIIESNLEINILHVGTRENFYKELRRRI